MLAGVSAKASYDVDSAVKALNDSFVEVCVASTDVVTKEAFMSLQRQGNAVSVIAAVARGDRTFIE